MPDLEGRHHGTPRGAAWTSRGGVTEGLEGRHHGTSRGDAMGPIIVLQLCKAQPSIKKPMQNCEWSYGAGPRVLCGTPQGPMALTLEVRDAAPSRSWGGQILRPKVSSLGSF